jgi:hypothetical protein
MSDQEAPRATVEPPSSNGNSPSGRSPLPPGAVVVENEGGGGSRGLRIALVVGLVLLAGMWAYALFYSMTRRDPVRLSRAEHDRVEQTCSDTIDRLRALPKVSKPPTLSAVVERTKAENDVLAGMVASLRKVDVQRADAHTAYVAWLHSWDQLLTARQHYEQQVEVDRGAELVIPIDQGTPITVKMNKYTDGKGLPSCNTTALGAEYVNAVQS